jgi:hypothetical protein
MRIVIRVILGGALMAGAAYAQVTPPATLIGTWEAVARSAGGLGTTLSFGTDNSLGFTIGAMVDFKYRRVRDSLFIVDPEGHTTPSRVRIVRDTLITTRGSTVQREVRVGTAASGDSLIGLWSYPHYTGVSAYEQYTPSGDLHLRIPIRSLKGTYTALGDSAMLHLPGPGGGDRAVRFAISADTLLLTWSGQTSRYLKTQPIGR